MDNKKEPALFYPFDSYVEDGKIIIVTTGRDMEGNRAVQLNNISLERAKQILSDLQASIRSIEYGF